jgi:ABC-2 type transport system ATP-binding protein
MKRDAANLLEVDGLGMQFSGQVLFRSLSFAYGPGVVALMGQNGVGKSTLLSQLAGVNPLQEGRVAINGRDLAAAPQRARQQLAFVPDESVAYDFMTGGEFLQMVLALRGQADAPALPALIDGLGLQAHVGKRFEAMSLGTRKKFMLASALASEAPVVLMDEPTNGIDAQAKSFLFDLFRRGRDSRLFLFSTHDQEAVVQSGAQLLELQDPAAAVRAT